ncbi:MAG: DNA mismatch repair protein MutS [Candidatus Heimdallarchaeota archaeon]
MSLSTPMLKQWKAIKRKYPNCIIFFRLGDFYETFGKDAKIASKTLGITLTSRGTGKNRIPLAGVPYHSLDGYLAKMVKAGYRVAICEQLQDPQEAKGLVDRDVVRIVTPGTLLESSILEEKSSNYIAAIFREKDSLGLAIAELSTGELLIEEWQDPDRNRRYHKLEGELASFSPSEILLADSQQEHSELGTFVRQNILASISRVQDHHFVYHSALEALRETLGVMSLEAFGCEDMPVAMSAIGGVLAYLKETQKAALKNFRTVKVLQKGTHLTLDSLTLRNLEVTKNLRDGSKHGTLLSVFQSAQTSMGNRLLQNWLLRPLINVIEIEKRHSAVERLVDDTIARKEICSLLRGISDIERIIGRVSYRSANPRDIAALRDSLRHIPGIKQTTGLLDADLLRATNEQIDDHRELLELLTKALADSPSQATKDGGIIAEGYSSEVDSLREIVSGSKKWLKRFEEKERQRSGFKSLKTGYNKVHGYYIEVTKAQLRGKKPLDDWEARQTLVNAQRFISKELKEYERRAMSADERLKNLEHELYLELLEKVGERTEALQQTASGIAILDVLSAFAETAVLNRYSRPKVNNGTTLKLQRSRHPVVEKIGGLEKFVPNDAFLDSESSRFLLIFGANMAGKSTYIRQIGLIVIMAQTGSFIPVEHAVIGIVDRIFTRMGAYDEISRSVSREGQVGAPGASTFMVEMREIATICHNATERSLILMDEVGRGTGTFDGLALAWTIAEFIHDNIKARSLLSTHYHQLSSLEEREGIQNHHLAIKETEDDLIFLYEVRKGSTDKSFGIHCARLAGVPKEIVSRAEQVLEEIEQTTEISIPRSSSKTADFQKSKKAKNISDFFR